MMQAKYALTRKFRTGIAAVGLLTAVAEASATGEKLHNLESLVKGNTLIIVNKFGPTFIHFEPSGVATQSSLDQVISEGTWRATDDSICQTRKPASDGKVFPEFCMKFEGRKIGDSWSSHDPKNGKIQFKLVSGKVRSLV